MNLAMIKRAIARHRFMKDAPAYREFLEEVRADGDVWCVPQREIASWWEQRQEASLTLDAEGRLDTHLENAVVEVDRTELRIPPFPLDSTSPDQGLPTLGTEFSDPFAREVISHLGYGHMLGSPENDPSLESRAARIQLEELRRSAEKHQRFDEKALDRLRNLLREAHRVKGLPELRIWTLPHRDGRPYRAAVSTRYDVDKAIVNLPAIHALEETFGLRSTVYLRPMGLFYGNREIRNYVAKMRGHEVALHGEFVTTAQSRFGTEEAAAIEEKRTLAELVGAEVEGVCMHGGELRTNTTPRTRDAVEAAGYRYETMYRNGYYLPLHLPTTKGVRRTLSIGQHFADISAAGDRSFPVNLRDNFLTHFRAARAVGGVFVPVMHPLYFGIARYLRYPENVYRLGAFLPVFVARAIQIKSGRNYVNTVE